MLSVLNRINYTRLWCRYTYPREIELICLRQHCYAFLKDLPGAYGQVRDFFCSKGAVLSSVRACVAFFLLYFSFLNTSFPCCSPTCHQPHSGQAPGVPSGCGFGAPGDPVFRAVFRKSRFCQRNIP